MPREREKAGRVVNQQEVRPLVSVLLPFLLASYYNVGCFSRKLSCAYTLMVSSPCVATAATYTHSKRRRQT